MTELLRRTTNVSRLSDMKLKAMSSQDRKMAEAALIVAVVQHLIQGIYL